MLYFVPCSHNIGTISPLYTIAQAAAGIVVIDLASKMNGYLIVHWYGALSHEQGHHSAICVGVLLRAQ